MTLVLGGTILATGARLDSFTPEFLLALIVLTYLVSLLSAAFLQSARNLRRLAALQLGWDLVLATGLVYVSGGAGSGFTFLYGVTVLLAALFVGFRSAQAAAVGALSIYVFLGVPLAIGWLPAPPDQPAETYLLEGSAFGFAIISNVVGLLLVAFLASNLSLRLYQAGGQLRRATESARSLARLNDDIVRSLSSGLLTTNLEGRLLTINQAGAEMFAADADTLIGEPLNELLPLAAEPSAQRGAGQATRPDGTHFPVGYTRNALFLADGEVGGVVVSFQDLTEIQKLRETAAQAERLATLGRLSAGLAHEIRNPLSSISGSVQLIEETANLEEEDRRLLQNVVNEVERLNDLVTTMLQVGRPTRPNFAATETVEIVRGVVEVANAGAAEAKGLRLVVDAAEPAVHVRADAHQLRQVIWNLLKNAMQASPAGSEIRLRVYRSEERAAIEVRDQGPGILPEIRRRLFETFYSSRPHGVGLGLALVKQIVDGHEGRIEVESETDGESPGSIFRVLLASAEAPARDSDGPSPPSVRDQKSSEGALSEGALSEDNLSEDGGSKATASEATASEATASEATASEATASEATASDGDPPEEAASGGVLSSDATTSR
ncbi:MAG: ATP-binding protein [Myxococcota bacterium]